MKKILLLLSLSVVATVAWAQRESLQRWAVERVDEKPPGGISVETRMKSASSSEFLNSDTAGVRKKVKRTAEDYARLEQERKGLTANLPAPLQVEEKWSPEVLNKVQTITTVISNSIGSDLNTDSDIYEINKEAARLIIDVRKKYTNDPVSLNKEIKEVEVYRDRKIMQILSDEQKKMFVKIINIRASDDNVGNVGLSSIYNF